jgi:hypothetical protein
MQASNIDNDSEHLPADTREGDVRGLGNAVVHELNQTRAEALRDIDKGCLSCVASLSLLLPRLFTATVLQSRFHLKLCLVAGTGFFTDA